MTTCLKTRLVLLIGLLGSAAGTTVLAQASGSVQSRVVTNESAAVAPESSTRAAPGRAAPTQQLRGLAVAGESVPIDSVARDLQRIVVLCATEPASEAFKTAWARHIEQHAVKAADLNALIDDVLERAEAYRAEHASTPRTNRTLTITTMTRSMMHDTAMAVIRKIG